MSYGASPLAGLFRDSKGHLYGAAVHNGPIQLIQGGNVFRDHAVTAISRTGDVSLGSVDRNTVRDWIRGLRSLEIKITAVLDNYL